MLSELRNSAIAATIIGVALIIILLGVLLSVLMRPLNLMGKGANALPPLRDKVGLELALVRRAMADFMKHKRSPADTADLVEQLRFGWDVAVEFALKRPLLYALFAQHVVANPDLAAEGYALMKARVQRLVNTGRFNQPVDVAARAVWAASQGPLSLAAQHVARKDVEMTSRLLFDAVVNELSRAPD
ncbi:hypothetical protein [Pseudomonas yamanorum]|uniref:hypothetical protein n=1 Tax=Pseudomonas yamanorum TaxID=515393 RepID=UPI00210B6377|nr:hypothetical protein [Pseudomonas yamanorum]